MQAMLDMFLAHTPPGPPFYSETVSCLMPESALAEGLRAIQEKNPEITLGSYPFIYKRQEGTSLVTRGRSAPHVQQTAQDVITLIQSLGGVRIDDPPNKDRLTKN